MLRVFDPSREEYNNENKTNDSCYFCDTDIIHSQECTRFSFTHWVVITNKHPYMNGNLMIIPKRHVIKISDLSPDEWKEFPDVLNAVQKELSEMFETESFNIGINVGEDSGRSIDHLHWQVIPRKKKNPTVVGVLAEIQVITMSSNELKKRLSE